MDMKCESAEAGKESQRQHGEKGKSEWHGHLKSANK